MENDKQLIQALVEYADKSASAIAVEAGLAVSTLTRPLNHPVKFQLSKPTLAKLRDTYPGFPGWGEGVPNVTGSTKLPDMVAIGEIDLSFGLGAQVMDEEVGVTQLTTHEFPLAWLRSITSAAPSELVWAKGQGDSMEPRISDGDIILIDRSKRSAHFGDLYWAIAYGQTAMIKRLRPLADGSLKILSDNPNVPDEIAWDGEVNIFGRVIAVVKNI